MKAELIKDNPINALTGLVNLFIVLLKLASKTKTNKAADIGNKGIKIDIFRGSTAWLRIHDQILYYF